MRSKLDNIDASKTNIYYTYCSWNILQKNAQQSTFNIRYNMTVPKLEVSVFGTTPWSKNLAVGNNSNRGCVKTNSAFSDHSPQWLVLLGKHWLVLERDHLPMSVTCCSHSSTCSICPTGVRGPFHDFAL